MMPLISAPKCEVKKINFSKDIFMQCDRCKTMIDNGEEKKLNGQLLCEDCCMDLMSPSKACDPWAVYSAKSFANKYGADMQLNPVQENILKILKHGPVEPTLICELLKIGTGELDRDLATLRHMEKIRGELRDGKRFILLW
jgi:hypothetical protein